MNAEQQQQQKSNVSIHGQHQEGKIFQSDEPARHTGVDQWQSFGHFLIERLTNDHPNTTIYLDYESGRRWTGLELKARILNVASALVDQYDFKPGTAVCISYDNTDLTFILSLGVILAGGIVACAYPKDPYAEFLYLARKVEPKFLFCGERNLYWIKQLRVDLNYDIKAIVLGYDDHVAKKYDQFEHFKHLLDYDYARSKCYGQLPIKICDLSRQVALITMSSGTTGKPKAVPVTHWNCIADLSNYRRQTTDGVHMACCASLDYVSGRIIALGAIQSGYTAVILNGFEPKTMLDAIERYKIHIIYLGASSFYNLITYKHIDNYNLDSLRIVFPMGAKIVFLDELSEFFRKHPNIIQVKQGFGSSETSGGAMSSQTPEEYLKDCANCGHLMPGNKAKIVDIETGRLLGPNEQGILHLKGESVFPGYYDIQMARKRQQQSPNNNIQLSPFVFDEQVFDSDGFYITGDLAYFNDKDELYIIGRHKEMMNCRDCLKVLPQELEEVIGLHPAVEKVTVLGVPHKRELTIICPRAFVVPREICYCVQGDSQQANELLQTPRLSQEAHLETDGDSEMLVLVGEHQLCKLSRDKRDKLAQDLMRFVNDRVAWAKQLTGGIVLLDDIPTSRATGKVDKNYLRSLTLAQVEIYGDRSN